MRARFVFEHAVNTAEKYYAPTDLVDHVVDTALDVIGEENISEIIEPSAGDGAFIPKLDSLGIPVQYYDLYPEHDKIKEQDFSTLDLPYKKGRLFLGGPPYGLGSKLWLMFIRQAAKMGDYIAYISPPSMHEENPYPQYLELLYSEQLPVQTFLGSKVRGEKDVPMKSSFNVYKVDRNRTPEMDPRDEQLAQDFKITQYERRMEIPGYRKSPIPEYDYYMSNWGIDLGNWYESPEKATSIGIQVKNEKLRGQLESFLDGFKEKYYDYFKSRSTSAPLVQVKKFKDLLKDELYGLNESVNFEREGTPYEKLRIGKNRFRPYPQMTPDEFLQWYESEIKPYEETELGIDMLIDSIINNEEESDEELTDYFRESEVPEELIKKLIPMRPYFWDFRYSQKIGCYI